MNLLLGLALVLGLVIALVFVRRAAKARKRKLLQRRARRTVQPRRTGPVSARSEMRAYEDPTTLARDITTTSGGKGDDSSGEKQ